MDLEMESPVDSLEWMFEDEDDLGDGGPTIIPTHCSGT